MVIDIFSQLSCGSLYLIQSSGGPPDSVYD